MVGVGGTLPTVTGTVAVDGSASPLDTVSFAVYVFAVAVVYVCVGFASVEDPPSPKSQSYESGPPPACVVPALENDTESGEWPERGVADADAVTPLKRIRRTSPVVNDR